MRIAIHRPRPTPTRPAPAIRQGPVDVVLTSSGRYAITWPTTATNHATTTAR